MRVEFRRETENDETETIGEIRLENGRLVAEGMMAERILARPVYDAQNREEVNADQPQRYLKLLSHEYQSPYLWATIPMD